MQYNAISVVLIVFVSLLQIVGQKQQSVIIASELSTIGTVQVPFQQWSTIQLRDWLYCSADV